ncbi:MFS transporter, partial [bacterium M00.F.Ca.ET.179.01.1.1]
AASSVAVDLKDSLGPSIGTALYALAPRLPWFAGIPLVAIASLGLGAAIGRARNPVDTVEDDAMPRSAVENYR